MCRSLLDTSNFDDFDDMEAATPAPAPHWDLSPEEAAASEVWQWVGAPPRMAPAAAAGAGGGGAAPSAPAPVVAGMAGA